MVLEKVIDIIAEELSVDPSEITEDSNLVEDLIRKLKTSRRLAKSFSSSKNIRVSKFYALCKTI